MKYSDIDQASPDDVHTWRTREIMAAMLIELSQKNLINFFCRWNQHGRRIIVFRIPGNWLQPTYREIKNQRLNKIILIR